MLSASDRTEMRTGFWPSRECRQVASAQGAAEIRGGGNQGLRARERGGYYETVPRLTRCRRGRRSVLLFAWPCDRRQFNAPKWRPRAEGRPHPARPPQPPAWPTAHPPVEENRPP